MKRETLLSRIHGMPGLEVIPRDADVQVKAERDGLCIVLTVPYHRHELYFEAEIKSSGKRIEDWMDYYGNSEQADFEEDFDRFFGAMARYRLRVDSEEKRIEYFEGEWQYMFGKVPGKWLR